MSSRTKGASKAGRKAHRIENKMMIKGARYFLSRYPRFSCMLYSGNRLNVYKEEMKKRGATFGPSFGSLTGNRALSQ
jgi:hypothetical protein